MKKVLFFCLFVSLSFFANAQYLRVAKQGRTWYTYVRATWLGNSTMVLSVSGDTTFNGNDYSWLVRNDSLHGKYGKEALLYEDTTAGIMEVYRFHSGSIQDTVRYDFSLNQGDTIVVKGPLSNQPSALMADSVFYKTDFRNVQRKVIRLVGADPNNWCHNLPVGEWIEGIASMASLGYPYHDCYATIEAGFTLKCVYDSTVKIYGDTVQQCYKLSSPTHELLRFEIFPNPIDKWFQIETELPLKELRLYDLQGKLLLHQKDPEKWLDVSALKPGLFILEVVDQDDRVGRRKLLKE